VSPYAIEQYRRIAEHVRIAGSASAYAVQVHDGRVVGEATVSGWPRKFVGGCQAAVVSTDCLWVPKIPSAPFDPFDLQRSRLAQRSAQPVRRVDAIT
jgi:hypothetical protein